MFLNLKNIRKTDCAFSLLKLINTHVSGDARDLRGTLRGAEGRKAIDPLTQEGRRVDFVVKGKDGVWRPIEVTSMTADKAAQLAKERNINALGGNFIRHPKTKELIKINGISKIIRTK